MVTTLFLFGTQMKLFAEAAKELGDDEIQEKFQN